MSDIAPGDLVVTADHGARPVLWVWRTEHHWTRDSNPEKPIRFAPGALGAGLPHRPLVVSPQHRLLVPGAGQDPGQDPGALAPAKAFTGLLGIRQMHGRRRAICFHLLFDRRQIVFAEGAPTESFFPGPVALQCLTLRHRLDILRLLRRTINGTGGGGGYSPARPFLKPGQLRRTGALTAPLWTSARLARAGLGQPPQRALARPA